MRDIKFSYMFQHDETGMFMEHKFTMEEIEGGDFINQIKEKFPRWNFVTRRQFTGLLDKNGKEIYEGDMLKFRTKENNFVKVYFDDGGFKMKVGNIISALSYFLHKYNCEIIGNIHENPELLN